MTDIVPIAGRPLLEVKNLTVEVPLRTGVFRAVSDLSFAIEPGKTLEQFWQQRKVLAVWDD